MSTTATRLARCWGVAENGESLEIALAPNLVDELGRRWPSRGLARHDSPTGTVKGRFGLSDTWLCVPDREPSSTHPSVAAWERLQSELAWFAVMRLTRLVPIHAAVVAWNGRALVLPGRPEAGKTTLAIAAHEAGADLLSDEYALVDPDTGLAEGWVRPARRRNPDGTVTRLDLAVPSGPLPVGLVALLTYDPDGQGFDRIAPAEAVVAIMEHTLATRSRPDDAFDAVVRLCRSTPVVQGTRGEATGAVVELLSAMDAAAVSSS